MAHREFKDHENRKWDVWDVFPSAVERRAEETSEIENERRKQHQARFNLPLDLRNGWLAFQSGAEIRRLAPIPPNWAALSDAALERLARSAHPIQRRHLLALEASTSESKDLPPR